MYPKMSVQNRTKESGRKWNDCVHSEKTFVLTIFLSFQSFAGQNKTQYSK